LSIFEFIVQVDFENKRIGWCWVFTGQEVNRSLFYWIIFNWFC